MSGSAGPSVDILSRISIFSNLDEKALENLGALFIKRKFKKDEIIFPEGSIGNSMMVITTGEVRISQKPDPNTEETLIILKKAGVFGEMALIEDLPRSATTIAHTDVDLLEIGRENFLNFVKTNCKNGVKILIELAKILSSRLRETDNKIKAFVNLSQWL